MNATEAETDDDPGPVESRVTPVVPSPNWMRDWDDGPVTPSGQEDAEEREFWNTPPRYSVTNLASLAPVPLIRAPSRWHTIGARLLFAAIFCAVVVLLVLEMKSLSARVPLTSTRALSVLLSPAP